jgi:ribonuclease HI
MPSPAFDSSNLFSAPKSATAAHTAHVDGGARGNPGPAGYGLVVHDPQGNKVAELSQYLGHRTNNYAEYHGLLAALRYAIAHKIQSLKIVSDSELMVRQMKGVYKVRHPELRKLYDEAQDLTAQIEHVEIRHALREHNRDADRLANEAMDRGKHSPHGEAEPRLRSEFAANSNSGGPSGTRPAPSEIGPAVSGPRVPVTPEEFEGIVRNGVIELRGGSLPEGTRVQVRVRR